MNGQGSKQDSGALDASSADENLIVCTDFAIRKTDGRGFEVRVMTQRGYYWVSANHADRYDGETQTFVLSLIETNNFLQQVRKVGLRTRYHGPTHIDLL
ncbi:hypothetical protein ABK249_21920 [Neorhizobium sp. Rsf11]|uniref:Uncharacterized protein n=1 Tax=Neorhizobium phenanthreniclasticum TaxID=3157917 RepID=A0ABV0M9B3_9HYPH